MKFVKQKPSLTLDSICEIQTTNVFRHGKLFPNTIRCIICGPSNCGKTNLMVGLLLHENGLRYINLYIYSKSLYQPKYVFLDKVINIVPKVSLYKYHEKDDVLPTSEAKSNSIIIFDDVACENQNNIRDYFAMGRHKNIDCFYLNQTYTKIPKQLIRDNANLIILFKQDDINLKHVYEEHVCSDMSWFQFRDMCSKVWKDNYSYVVINKDCDKDNGRYRNKLDTYIIFD